jgi:predicted NUDIX family NTP pyrophosphohydrolase
MSRRKSEISAGLLAFRRRGSLELLLAHPGGPFWAKKDDGAWTIPKGRVDGLLAEGVFIPLAPVKQKSGKVVHAWAFEADYDLGRFTSNTFELEWPPRSGRREHYPEIDRIAYFDLDSALTKIIAYQRPFLTELIERLEGMPKLAGQRG